MENKRRKGHVRGVDRPQISSPNGVFNELVPLKWLSNVPIWDSRFISSVMGFLSTRLRFQTKSLFVLPRILGRN